MTSTSTTTTADTLLDLARQWCREHGQEPTRENLERIIRYWRVTRQQPYIVCSDALGRLYLL